MIVGDQELWGQVRKHCEKGSPDSATLHRCMYGCGNTVLVYGIVIGTINQISDHPSVHPQHLGIYVANAVCRATDQGFSWRDVTRIIESAGKAGLRLNYLDRATSEDLAGVSHPTNSIPYGQNHFRAFTVKECVRAMAQAILWLQAISFLEGLGYSFEDPASKPPVQN